MDGNKPKPWLGSSIAGGFKGLKNLSRKKSDPAESHIVSTAKPRQKRPSVDKKVLEEDQKKALAKREKLKDESISSLPEGFFEEDFDPGLFELQQLEPGFQVQVLDEVAEGRANALEFVSERLSRHVLANYDMFLKGINEAASVETDLQAAISAVRSTRGVLATTQIEVDSHLSIASRQKQRLALAQIANTLLNLQQALHLQNELRAAAEEADFTTCFWLCAQCCDSLEKLGPLTAADELQRSVNKAYQDSERRMHAALATVCADFDDARYCKVVEAHTFLGNTEALGEEVNSSFVNVINTSTMKVVRGVVLTRSGLQERAQNTTILQEILKWLPPDLYRQCLSKVLMVLFDILASHHRMTSWHEDSIRDHISKLGHLKEQIDDLHLASNEQMPSKSSQQLEEDRTIAEQPPISSEPSTQGTSPGANINGNSKGRHSSTDRSERIRAGESKQGASVDDSVASTEGIASLIHGAANKLHAQAEEPRGVLAGPAANGHLEEPEDTADPRHENDSTSPERHLARNTQKDAQTSPMDVSADAEVHTARLLPQPDEAERNPLQESEAVARLQEEYETESVHGETLMRVAEALASGRKWVWDEAGRKVSLLLSSPAAFQGEHFLQVLEWTQTIVLIGEAFSGSESSHLRDAMQRHSGKFFQAYHAGNLQALQQMLDQEMWTALPALPGRALDFKAELEGKSKGNSASTTPVTFPEWLELQNPWKRQTIESRVNSVNLDDQEQPSAQATESVADVADTDHEPPMADSSAACNGKKETRRLFMTNASWKMMQWMCEYAGLMRLLPTDASRIYSCCCELFELYFLHTFCCFGEVPLADILKEGNVPQAAIEALPVRLRTALVRVITRSLPQLQGRYLPQPTVSAQQQGLAGPAVLSISSQKANPATTTLNPTGGLFGLQERKVAVDSLDAAAKRLQAALPLLTKLVSSSPHVPEHHTLENFRQTLKAAHDLRDVILTAGARLNLPISWLPERLSEQNFNLEEPPTKASPWVGVLYQHAKKFWQHLASIESMSDEDRLQLWQYGLQYMAELVLEGFARAGVKGKCTMMGRSAMSVDLQGLQRGLQTITPGRDVAASITNSMRIVDAYIKAFYLPWGDELHKWAMTHPEYTQAQIIMLVNCIAEFQSVKRKERNQLIGQIEVDLRELR